MNDKKAVTSPDSQKIQKAPEEMTGAGGFPAAFCEEPWSNAEPLREDWGKSWLVKSCTHFLKPLTEGGQSLNKRKSIKIKSKPAAVNLPVTKWVHHSECFWLQVTKCQITLAYTIRNCIISQNWKFGSKADQVQYNQQFSKVIKSSGFLSLLCHLLDQLPAKLVFFHYPKMSCAVLAIIFRHNSIRGRKGTISLSLFRVKKPFSRCTLTLQTFQHISLNKTGYRPTLILH